MKKNITFYVLLLAMLLIYNNSSAQISVSITTTSPSIGCFPLIFQGTGVENSATAITQRRWCVFTCAGAQVTCTNTSLTNTTFSYIFSNSGCFKIVYTATNAAGQSAADSFTVDVGARPIINFNFSPTEGCCGLNVQAQCNINSVTGNITSLNLQTGCGSLSFNSCPTQPININYPCVCPPGQYNINVVATNSYGCFKDSLFTNAVRIIPNPVANFTGTAPLITNCSSNPVSTTFNADSAGPNMTYAWFVNNQLQQSGSSRVFNYSFPVNPICYDVKLVVTHPSGCRDSLVRAGYVCNRPSPVVTFSQNFTTTCVNTQKPATLVLTNTSPGLPDLTWSFSGGGGSTTGPSASYTITTAGTYTVTATGVFAPGCSTTVSQQVLTAVDKPVAVFTVDDTFSCKLPFTVNYTASTCTGCTYNWNIQGAGTPSGVTVPVTYNAFSPNGFNARLVVTAPNGCTDTLTQNGLVKTRRISPVISANTYKGCAPLCPTFTDNTNYNLLPGETPVSRCWSFPGSTIPASCTNPYNTCFTTPGCYNVRLVVQTTDGCIDSTTLIDTVCVGSPPVCTITATPTTMCYEETPVSFNLNCNDFNFAVVNYGDGSPIQTVFSPSFSHMYQDVGVFNTVITPYKDSCIGQPINVTITVNPPVADFTDSVSCVSGDTVYFKNQTTQATSYLWTFCNGVTSTDFQPMISLPTCTTCQVSLTAFNSTTGCTHTVTRNVTTACNVSSLAPLDTSICVPRNVTFVNTSPNSIQTRWALGCPPNLTFSGSAAPTRTYNFPNPGNFCVAMINVSPGGCRDTLFASIKACKVTADFGPTSICLPNPFCFTDLSIDTVCSITKWRWDFGVNSLTTDTSSLQNPCYQYTTPGAYQVKLVVENDAGCRDSIIRTVIVGSQITLNYDIDTLVCPGNQSCVTNNSVGAPGVPLTFHWSSPGAVPPSTTAFAPCFSFPSSGSYPVYLEVTSGNQCTVYDTFTVFSQNPIASGFVSTNLIPCPTPPTQIDFINTSQFYDSLVVWSFGPGAGFGFGIPGDTVRNFYTTPGDYPIFLKVLTNEGCSDSIFIDTIKVRGPYGSIDFNPKPGICSCKDSVTIDVTTVRASTLTLLYGCNLGSLTTNISPIGLITNPSTLSFSYDYCITDSCQPQVIFGDTTGCFVSYNAPFVMIDSPVVAYSYNNYGACLAGTVCFQDITSYTLPPNHSFTVKRVWDFGDGSPLDTTNNPSPCHFYSQSGGYGVRLYVWSNLGCFDSIVSNVVVISEYPEAGFYADDTLVCANSPACFHDSSQVYNLATPDFWVWDFGDGTIDTVTTPDVCHAYSSGGIYRVTMCIYDNVGCPDCDSSVFINVVDNPVAVISGNGFACYGTTTQLQGTGAQQCQWSPPGLFSDPNSCSPTVQLIADTTIILTVSDQFGCVGSDTSTLTVARVFADFTVGSTFCQDVPVCVTDGSTAQNSTVSDWIYVWGDNSPNSTGSPNPCHVYATASGLQTITLIALDQNGCTDTATNTVLILSSPTALFSLNDSIICSSELLCPTDISSGSNNVPITNWSWSYGDGFTWAGANAPCHRFNAPYQPGYTVQLIVVDQNTCADTFSAQVIVNEEPVANFNWSVSCETDVMPLTNTSIDGDGQISFCQWNFNVSGQPVVNDFNCNTAYQFPAGSHTVDLIVRDVNGCSDTISKLVSVDSVSQLTVFPGDTTICLGTSVTYTVDGVFDNVTWTPNVWLSDPNAAVVTVTPLGNIGYIVSAVNGVCAAASDTFVIRTIQPVPIEVIATPDKIVLGLTSNITSQIPGQIDSIVWTPDATLDCNNCPNPIAQPTQTTTYTATIFYSENGVTCTNSAQVTIQVLNNCDDKIVYVPNTFTPNGDGLNDVFMIRGLAATKLNYLRIFDRWGKLVYQTGNGAPNDPRWGWDGTDLNGAKLNPAVFVYMYEIECINGDVVTGNGNITLIR